MKHEVAEHRDIPVRWHVKRVLDDGAVEVATFTGPRAKERALEYINMLIKAQHLTAGDLANFMLIGTMASAAKGFSRQTSKERH